MSIILLLDRNATEAAAVQRDLLTEINALGNEPGISLRTQMAPPPAGTLSVAEAFQFVIDHKDAALLLPVVKSVLEIVTAVLRRHQASTPTASRGSSSQYIVLVVGDKNKIGLPASAEKQRRFLTELRSTPKGVKKARTSSRTRKPTARTRRHSSRR